MKQQIHQFALLIDDYDEAIKYYTQKLNFDLLEDTTLNPSKRWVRIAPKGSSETGILLAKASNKAQQKQVGMQAGGRVFLFLYTDDFWRDYNSYKAKGVHFTEEPREESFGTVIVFEDLYGNKWDLIEPKSQI